MLFLLLLLSLLAFSHAVDIILSGLHVNFESLIRCSNIPPGICCRAPNADLSPEIYYEFANVTFSHLHALDIAAVWRGGARIHMGMPPGQRTWVVDGCRDSVLESRRGPGEWTWLGRVMPPPLPPDPDPGRSSERAVGASYIRLPADMPPGPNIIHSLAIQGILGLAWGGSSWFASDAAKHLLAGARGTTLPVMIPRSIRSETRGNVWARSPVGVMYPSSMRINGTEYTADETKDAGNLLYTDQSSGASVNLTDWFI